MGELDLLVPHYVAVNQPFGVAVVVTSARPGAEIRVVVSEHGGGPPAVELDVLADSTGSARADADMVLPEAGEHVLVATAEDLAGAYYFKPDAEQVVAS